MRYVHPWIALAASVMPAPVTYGALLLFIADGFLSARVLRRGGNVDLMSLPRLIRALSH